MCVWVGVVGCGGVGGEGGNRQRANRQRPSSRPRAPAIALLWVLLVLLCGGLEGSWPGRSRTRTCSRLELAPVGPSFEQQGANQQSLPLSLPPHTCCGAHLVSEPRRGQHSGGSGGVCNCVRWGCWQNLTGTSNP